MILVMASVFRWNGWNSEHVAKHGCAPAEAERVVRGAGRGWPRNIGDGKWRVEGRGQGGRVIEVVFVRDPDRTLYIIHAMPLTTRRRRG